MIQSYRFPTVVVAAAFAALFLAGCKNDSIPTTLPGPYNLTRITLTKNMAPLPSDTLHQNDSLGFHLEIAYTLAPAEAARRDSLELAFAFLAIDAADSILGFIGPSFPYRRIALTADESVVPISAPLRLTPIGHPYFLDLYVFFQKKNSTAFDPLKDELGDPIVFDLRYWYGAWYVQ